MAVVELKLPHHQYEIHIEPGLLRQLGKRVREQAPHHRAALVYDVNMADLHAHTAMRALESCDYHVVTAKVPAGESAKNLDTVRDIYTRLVDARFERKSPLVALGGGVVGDLAGFVAATYQRGVPFIQCPTTLLAMVDSSVGGKVGVNLPQGKNLVGAFYQPRLVIVDTDTLATLPRRELCCGLAECVKHAVIRDADQVDWLETHLDAVMRLHPDTMVELVRWNVQIKAEVVMADEKEAGERAHLNFGHTFAHAIEATSGYGTFHHGEAVSLGMVAAARLSAELGHCPPELPQRLEALLSRIGLPTTARDLAPTDELMTTMRLDKKVADDRLRLVLVDRLGAVSVRDDITDAAISAAWESLRR